jgi:hypothetical protein
LIGIGKDLLLVAQRKRITMTAKATMTFTTSPIDEYYILLMKWSFGMGDGVKARRLLAVLGHRQFLPIRVVAHQ